MGQQQLLLIVLGVIIVGIAIVLGIQYFSVGAEEAAKDELVAHCLAVGSNAQQWYKKPVSMGGGGGDWTANGGWTIPTKMQVSSSCGTSTVDQTTGAITVTSAGYVENVAAQKVTITATPNNSEYQWTIVCTVFPENMTTVVTPNGSGG